MVYRIPHRWLRWPAGATEHQLAYGADYNPEQWPSQTWAQDVRLMGEAGVNIVSLAIFSWARIQPSASTWDFDWLDEVMDLLHENSIAVDLATATASPPPWLTSQHPEILPVNRLGETIWPGARQHWRPTSPVFRQHALTLTTAMAQRYGAHPALSAWHVSNELGCHNVWDYSQDAAQAFRMWLRNRYKRLDVLNEAWGTSFWSQRYTEWAQILPPRLTASHPNPTQQLDFRRFSSDALKDYLRAERDVLAQITPQVPVTTNFMIMGQMQGMDYPDWAAEVDFVSNDHYVTPGPQELDELSFSANLTGHIADRAPWFLMEHSTSAVNWQPINIAKAPGSMARDSLTHVAHGADAVCFFQWRQSVAGTERYHSAMVPHAGADSDVFRSVVALGSQLKELADVAGSRVAPARAAILFDWDSWWTSELDSHPSSLVRYRQEALDWYSAFLDVGLRVDVIPTHTDFSGYELIIAPVLHVVGATLSKRLDTYVQSGGHLVATYFSGIVDENDHVYLGGYPGALRDLLGIRIQEFSPLPAEGSVSLDNGLAGTVWTDQIQITDRSTRPLACYVDGPQAGKPAVTRRSVGAGSASYVGTRLGTEGIAVILRTVLRAADITPELPEELRGKVELAVRTNDATEFLFLINRTNKQVEIPALSTGSSPIGSSRNQPVRADVLAPREVRVLRKPLTRGLRSPAPWSTPKPASPADVVSPPAQIKT